MIKAIIENNIAVNTIVIEEGVEIEGLNLVIIPEGFGIGDRYEDGEWIKYTPTTVPDDVAVLKAQLNATVGRQEFLEDLIAELAMMVYD